LLDHWLSEQEFADIVEASDAVLLPYREITGSGALLAAWTLGRGVVASDLPYFREVSKPEPDAAQFFPVENSPALAGAILEYTSIPFEVRHRAALRMAERYTWEWCVESLVQLLEDWRTKSNVKDTASPPPPAALGSNA